MKKLSSRPTTRRNYVVDNYHGTPVADPYRWLEDDNGPGVKKWMEEQSKDFEEYIGSCDLRDRIHSRLSELWHYEKAGVPSYHGGYYYTWRNNGLQNQHALYRSPTLDQVGELVFDPNTLSDDGTVAIGARSFSPTGRFFAYTLSKSGSDWQEIRVFNLQTLQDCGDLLHFIKFSDITWLPDDGGFFYTCYPQPEKGEILGGKALNSMVYLHTLGQKQCEDTLIYKDDTQPEWMFSVFTDEDKQWLFLSISPGTTLPTNKLFYKPLANLDCEWLPIAPDFIEGGYDVIGAVNNTAYIFTLDDAPMGKVLSVELTPTGTGKWQTVVEEKGYMIEHVKIANKHLLINYLQHANVYILVYNLNGRFLKEIEMPVGSIVNISGKNSQKECFIQFNSFLYPRTVFKYDFDTNELTTVFSPKIDFEFDKYETKLVYCMSHYGTQVPLYITHAKDLELNGNNPTLLYGYGGFSYSLTPSFSTSNLLWLENGGVYVTAGIRGGLEFGEEWHQEGMLDKKQNCFDDFIAAAQYLIDENYTNPKKLAIEGASNGGLLTAACLTQRPELFGAVLVCVPVIDMLRYHHFTAGRYWVGEYGSSENPYHFRFLYKYSPLHNVKMNTVYPPTLIMTADTDDRVIPGHARKFAATLQAADGGVNPILIRIEKSAGHGAGKPVSKVIAGQTDLYVFLLKNLINS